MLPDKDREKVYCGVTKAEEQREEPLGQLKHCYFEWPLGSGSTTSGQAWKGPAKMQALASPPYTSGWSWGSSHG